MIKWLNTHRNWIASTLLAAFAIVLVGCNTVEGAGEGIQEDAQTVQEEIN